MIIDHPYHHPYRIKDTLRRLEKASRTYSKYKVPQSVKSVMVTRDNRILMLRRPGSRGWDLPGGGVEKWESLPSAYKREIREETGLRVNNAMVLYSFFRSIKGKEPKMIHYVGSFIDTPANEIKVKLSSEHDEYCFCKWSEIKSMDLMPSYLKALKLAKVMMIKPRKAWLKIHNSPR